MQVTIQALGHHYLLRMMNFGAYSLLKLQQYHKYFQKSDQELGFGLFFFPTRGPFPFVSNPQTFWQQTSPVGGAEKKKRIPEKTMGRCNTCTVIR